MSVRPIRVLIAEDSPTARALLVHMLESDAGIRVVGQATSGAEAVEMVDELGPDLVTMDVHMPELDGLEATKQIMARCPCPIIIVSSRARDRDVALSLDATRAGALMVLPKPEGPAAPGFAGEQRQLVSMVKALSQVKVVRRWGTATQSRISASRVPTPVTVASAVKVVAIAASTGGPAALREILAALPPSYPAPILVVQHIARGFVGGLASWLATSTRLRVKVADDAERTRPGTVYVGPDDRHLGVRANREGTPVITLSASPPIGAFRPSATALFESVAAAFGESAVAVILTGMGDDGVAGLRAIRVLGGRVFAQDEESSVIYGMPREAARAGVVTGIYPLHELPRKLLEVVS